MYRLKVKVGKKWKVGINSYSLQQAQQRLLELQKIGIQSKIYSEKDLFSLDCLVVW